jgi:hypothetical protein
MPGGDDGIQRVLWLVCEPSRQIVCPSEATDHERIGSSDGSNRIDQGLHADGVPRVSLRIGVAARHVLIEPASVEPAVPRISAGALHVCAVKERLVVQVEHHRLIR